MRETRVQFLGQEDPLEKEMAIHSSTLAWKIPWTEEPGRLQSMGVQRVRHNWATSPTKNVMLKILQVRLQQYVNCELPDVQVGFRKGRRPRGQIANINWIIEKAREFQEKHLLLLHWLPESLWLCGSQQTVENSERDRNIRPPDLPSEKFEHRSKSSN